MFSQANRRAMLYIILPNPTEDALKNKTKQSFRCSVNTPSISSSEICSTVIHFYLFLSRHCLGMVEVSKAPVPLPLLRW